MGLRGPKPINPSIRFWEKVAIAGDDECWLWQGHVNKGGYGRFGVSYGWSVQAHRYSYEEEVGPIPEGLDLDHLCRVRHCVNPRHLEPVTRSENLRRGDMGGRPQQKLIGEFQRNKTHCSKGHEFTPENTRVYYYAKTNSHHRACKTCNRQRTRVSRGLPPGD